MEPNFKFLMKSSTTAVMNKFYFTCPKGCIHQPNLLADGGNKILLTRNKNYPQFGLCKKSIVYLTIC